MKRIRQIISVLLAVAMIFSVTHSFAMMKQNIEYFTTKQRAWDIQVDNSIVYLADGTAGVQIVDTTDKENFALLANINTGVDARVVEKKGDILYVCGGGQMFVYNVKKPEKPVLLKTDIIQQSAARANFDGNILGVFGGATATIFDASDKVMPEKAATIGGIGNMLGGYVKDNYVYVISKNTLYIYDISDFSNVKTTASLVIDTVDYAPDIIVEDDYLYIADDTVLATVDVSDKTKPQVILSEDYAVAKPNGLYIDGDTLFLGGYNQKVLVFDISKPEKPVKTDECSANSGVYALMTEDDNYIYCAGMGGAYVINRNFSFDKTKLPPFLSESEVFGDNGASVKYENPFDDTKGHWAEEHIAKMSGLGYVKGRENNKFVPEDNITRAEFIAIAVRMATPALERYKYRFLDVDSEAWYADYIETAYIKGLIPEEMVENNKLLPNEKITREEMAAITVNLMKNLGIEPLETKLVFDDADDISKWAKDYVGAAYSLGLINGMEDNKYMPKNPSTRAQVCKILASAYDMTLEADAEFISKTKYNPAENTTKEFTKAYEKKNAQEGYPIIISVTDAVKPGDLVSFFGEYLSNPIVYLEEGVSEAPEPSENAVVLEVIDKDDANQCVTCMIPENAKAGAFTAYIKNSAGFSAPVPVNMARLTWVDREVAQKDDIIRINGRNFAGKEFDAELNTSVALVNEKATYNLSIKSINPFMVEAYIGEDVASGEYDVYISNDGERWVTCDETYGKIIVKDKTYDPYNLNQPWADEFDWDNKIDVTQAPYNADKTGVSDSTSAIQKAIDDAHNAGGGVVYFPEGEYKHTGLQMDSKVVLMGAGMEKSKIIYAYKGDDVASKQMIGTKGDAKINGRIGFMNLGIFSEDSATQYAPDAYLWLGEDWGSNIDNASIRTAEYIFIKGCKLWSPMIYPAKSTGRGLGVVCVVKGNTLFENNIFYGKTMSVVSSYMGKYVQVINNHFTTAVGNLTCVASNSTIVGNVMNRNWEYGTELLNTQGVFMRGYSYVADNIIRKTGMPGSNDGELVCSEVYRAGTRMSGKVVGADKTSITVEPLKNSAGELLYHAAGGWSLNVCWGDKWDVVITAGKGLGQRRRVLSLDESTQTFQIENEWDIIPDSTSKFVFIISSYSTTIYNNYAHTGAKGMWVYGDSYDSVISENNLIDTEGCYIYTCHNDSIGRTNIAYFNRMSKNVSRGFGSKSGLNGIGILAGVEFAAPTAVPAYGASITDNLIVGGDVLPEQSQVTEAPPICGIYAVNRQSVKATNSNTVMKGVIIEDNRVEKLDRGISLGNTYDIDINKSGQNVLGPMSENIVLKGNTFSEVQNEILDFKNEGTFVD